jgi:diacylglycerol kinase family enzyme
VHVACTPTTAEPNSARTLAAKAVDGGVDLVIAFGGDGTARQVAEGVHGSDVPMAVFPGGTGNLFAQNFMAPPPPAEFATMLMNGTPQPIDLIQYDTGRDKGVFMVGLGFGPLSDAISDANPKMKRIFGRAVYAFNVVRKALRPGGITARIEASNGQVINNVPVAAAFALNVVPHTVPFLSRGCTPNDGLLDFVVVKGRHFHQVLGCGACLTAMRPERSRHYQRVRSNELSIKINRSIALNVDGDPGPVTSEVRLTVLPGAVKMILA